MPLAAKCTKLQATILVPLKMRKVALGKTERKDLFTPLLSDGVSICTLGLSHKRLCSCERLTATQIESEKCLTQKSANNFWLVMHISLQRMSFLSILFKMK